MKTVLSIAGTDPTGGAGIQTDLKTFEAFGVYGMAVITVVCAQNTTGVFGMQPVSAELVGKQIDCVFDDIFPDAVKVGMLYDAEIIHTVAERLKAYHAKNIVLDPVMMSSSGTALLHHDAAKVLQEELFPLCTLVTPNLHEAAPAIKSPIVKIWSRRPARSSARPAVPFWSRVVIWQTAQMICCLTAQECTGFPRRVLTTRTRTVPAARYPVQSHADWHRACRSSTASSGPSGI